MRTLQLIKREPDKAYVDDMLWLPKTLINPGGIKTALEFWELDKDPPVLRRLWDETRDHLICPREFLKPENYPQFSFPFVDLTPKSFPRTGVRIKNPPRNEDQVKADAAFAKASAGVLNLACGKGKTYLALKKIADLGCPALIVVHNSFLMNQWVNDAIPTHLELPQGEKVGIIQGEVVDWKHPITVAMIQTLASREADGKLPAEMREWFGVVVYDEVHHLSAPVFATTAPIVLGQRYGLTATHQRVDGLDFIFKFHLGDVFYVDLVQKLIPRVYFQKTPVSFELDIPKVRDRKGELSIGKLRSYIGNLEESNRFRASCLKEALKEGRKIIAVSHSKNQLCNLHKMFPDSGLIVQETPQEERHRIVKRSKVTFAIASLGAEGLDDDQLDTVFILLPFGSRGTRPNDLQQVIGRVQRELPGRKAPVVVIFDDEHIRPLRAMCHTMRNQLRHWDKFVQGMPAIPFQNLAVP
jgi:superfamily II DNA or RNA helicase